MCEKEKCEQVVREVLEKIQQEKEDYNSNHLIDTYMAFGMMIAVGVLGVIVIVSSVFDKISTSILVKSLPPISLTIFIGLLIFALRHRFRLYYGIVELLIGAWNAAYIVISYINANSFSYDMLFPFSASLYVMVRGIDNIGQGITHKDHKLAWLKFWDDFSKIFNFLKRSKKPKNMFSPFSN